MHHSGVTRCENAEVWSMSAQHFQSSSLRTQGPITPGGYWVMQRSNKEMNAARNIDDTAYGSCVRGDDSPNGLDAGSQ
jgi:hypothetical protein